MNSQDFWDSFRKILIDEIRFRLRQASVANLMYIYASLFRCALKRFFFRKWNSRNDR